MKYGLKFQIMSDFPKTKSDSIRMAPKQEKTFLTGWSLGNTSRARQSDSDESARHRSNGTKAGWSAISFIACDGGIFIFSFKIYVWEVNSRCESKLATGSCLCSLMVQEKWEGNGY